VNRDDVESEHGCRTWPLWLNHVRIDFASAVEN
jgi:hypothetical protein